MGDELFTPGDNTSPARGWRAGVFALLVMGGALALQIASTAWGLTALSFWASALIPFLSVGIIYINHRRGIGFELSWKIFMAALTLRGVAHFIPVITGQYDGLLIDNRIIQSFFYLAGLILVFIGVYRYFVARSLKWSRYMVYTDAFFFFVVAAMLVFNLVILNARYLAVNPILRSSSLALLAINLLASSLVLSLLSYIHFRKLVFGQILVGIGVGLLVIGSSLRGFYVFDLKLVPPDVQRIFFSTSYSFLAVASAVMVANPLLGQAKLLLKRDLFSRYFNFALMASAAVGAFFLRLLEPIIFTRMVFVLIWYFVSRKLVELLEQNETLLKEHQEYTNRLEDLVRERTRRITMVNQELVKVALTDQLTGLGSRTFLLREMAALISTNTPFALFVMDIVRFQYVNDIHGNAMGDRVLKVLGERAQNPQFSNLVSARMGGDEFAALLPNHSEDQFPLISAGIIHGFEAPIDIDGYVFNLQTHIGVAQYPQDGNTPDEILKCANLALMEAKAKGGDVHYRVYSRDISNAAERRIWLEYLLQHMDPDANFKFHYQPQFDIRTRKLVGVEALLRWYHPDYGFIPPNEFIPIAEESGMITVLTEWTLRNGMRQIKQWNEAYGTELKMGINLSPRYFNFATLFDTLKELIEETGVNPSWVDIEITEYSPISRDVLVATTSRLKNMGFSISVDDFGTGYSSLSYLVNFQADNLKIAKELVDNIASNATDRNVVKAIISMAEELGIYTIAEGVETQDQFTVLENLHCRGIQGYLLGRPIAGDLFEKNYLQNQNNE